MTPIGCLVADAVLALLRFAANAQADALRIMGPGPHFPREVRFLPCGH
jgi:hypothetical protein